MFIPKCVAAVCASAILAVPAAAPAMAGDFFFTETDPISVTEPFSLVRQDARIYATGAGVADNLTALDFHRAVRREGSSRMTLHGAEGGAIYEGCPLATGQRVLVATAGGEYTVTAAARGDLTGDGRCGIADLSRAAGIMRADAEADALTALAADINGDGRIDIGDLIGISRQMHISQETPQTPSDASVSDSIVHNEGSQTALADTNAARLKIGLPSLREDSQLNQAAMVRAREMAHMKKISHTRPDGSSCDTVHGGNLWRGENCASYQPTDDIPGKSVEMWISSPAHYENIVGECYTRMGYAFVRGEQDRIYACQLFASDGPIDFIDDPILW